MGALIHALTEEQQESQHVFCCWTGKDEPDCAHPPVFRLATPHGHMDFCDEHIDAMIVGLPPEWLGGFAYREPPPVTATGDDIPF